MPGGLTRRTHRILMTADAVGGVWQYATDLAAALARRGVEPVIAAMGPAPAPFRPPGVRVVDTALPLDWTAADEAELDRASEALAALARDLAATSVHLHAPALAGTAAWPAPVVAVAHSCVGTWWAAVKGNVHAGPHEFAGGGVKPTPRPHCPPAPLLPDLAWRAARTARGLRTATRAVAPTAAFADALRAVYGALAIEVIHNGRDPGHHPPARPEGHALTVGRLWDEGKNVHALDRVGAHLPIHAAGPVDGPGASGRFDHLHLLGTLSADELAQARARASAFVSVPRYEPFGLAILEAAQSGLPLVLSDIPTLRELWDGAAAFVGDEADLVPTLRRVLAKPGELGRRAKARAARYTVDAMADRTLALHRTLAG